MTKKECVELLIESGHHEFNTNKYCKNGSYTLRHGEYESPEYRILKHRGIDDYYISAKYFYLSGTFGAPKSGPLGEHEMNTFYYAIQMKREA